MGIFGMGDPLGMVIDAGGNLLGLPPIVTGAAKVVAGIYTGDVVCAVDGGLTVVGELSKQAHKTEYCPPKNGEPPKGYCSPSPAKQEPAPQRSAPATCASSASASRSDDPRVELDRCLGVIEANFATFDKADFMSGGFKDGRFGMKALESLANNPTVSIEVRDAANWLLTHPEQFNRVDFSRSQRTDGAISGDEIRFIREQLKKELQGTGSSPPPATTGCPGRETQPVKTKPVETKPVETKPVETKPAPSLPDGVRSDANSPLPYDILEYRQVLRELQASWNTFDAAVGTLDFYLTRENLEAIQKNPNADPTLKHVSSFLLAHPEYFNRLEMASHIGGKDGIVGLGDVLHELKNVDEDLKTYGAPTKKGAREQGTGGTSPGTAAAGGSAQPRGDSAGRTEAGSISDILNDPNLSLEQKVQLVLMKIAEAEDDEMLDAVAGLGSATEELAGMRASTAQDDADGQKKLARKQQDVELLQQRIQKATEKRKQMYDLMSNMSSKFNEMAMKAIQNLARA